MSLSDEGREGEEGVVRGPRGDEQGGYTMHMMHRTLSALIFCYSKGD